jgi:hypothetical protein
MFLVKVIIYSATILAVVFFAFWELRLKRQLTDGISPDSGMVSESGFIHDLSKRMERERVLRSLPKEKLVKFRRVVALKFLLVALLIIEVFVLQRPA